MFHDEIPLFPAFFQVSRYFSLRRDASNCCAQSDSAFSRASKRPLSWTKLTWSSVSARVISWRFRGDHGNHGRKMSKVQVPEFWSKSSRYLDEERKSADQTWGAGWWLVYLPLWKMMEWKSVGVIIHDYSIPNWMESQNPFHGSSHHRSQGIYWYLTYQGHDLTKNFTKSLVIAAMVMENTLLWKPWPGGPVFRCVLRREFSGMIPENH